MAFFVLTWPGRIVLVILGLVAAGVAFGGTMVGLAMSGGPDDCTSGGGPIVVNDGLSDDVDLKWDEFQSRLDAGSAAAVTFSESELTSRTITWINEEDGPDFDDVSICLHDGYGEATGTLNGPGFFDVTFKIRGVIELEGDHIIADTDDVDIGNIPDPLTSFAEISWGDPVDEDVEELDLGGHSYTIVFTEGSVTIEGLPAMARLPY